jgi:peptide/nickel transport system ATP-binding protein
LNRVIERTSRQILKAVDGVSFEIKRGETLSLVGESGCGKSTVARLICGLYAPTRGSVIFDGTDLGTVHDRTEMLTFRRRFQMIFQDPYASLNPRWRVHDIVAEPIRSHKLISDGAALTKRVASCSVTSGSRRKTARNIRTSFPAGSASASRSRAPCRRIRNSSFATSPRARSTCRCRRRS